MLGATKLIRTALVAMAALAFAFSPTTSAEAHGHGGHGGHGGHWHGHGHGGGCCWGWGGGAFIGGLALGALASAPYYYGGCHTERRIYYGHVRYVRVCY